MTGKLVGTGLVIGGVIVGIATVHLITIVAVLMVLTGAGTYKLSSGGGDKVLTAKAKRALR